MRHSLWLLLVFYAAALAVDSYATYLGQTDDISMKMERGMSGMSGCW